MSNQTPKSNISNTPSHTNTVIGTCLGLVTGAFLMLAFTKAGRDDWSSHLISLTSSTSITPERVTTSSSIATPTTTTTTLSEYATSPIQLESIIHYATSKVTPQQSLQEIKLSYNVLKNISPCNFLVFGLGYDSLMWASLNPNGQTLFLEESQDWVNTVLKDAPYLKAKTVSYRTQLHEADHLLVGYRGEPECNPRNTYLKGNLKCRLALDSLPEEVYETEWDVIMIDAPRGYFREAPGRMAAIYSVAVMARSRKGPGNTHVYLHDVDRKVEKEFAKEFLCMKYKVEGVGRLWHFEIPSVGDHEGGDTFC